MSSSADSSRPFFDLLFESTKNTKSVRAFVHRAVGSRELDKKQKFSDENSGNTCYIFQKHELKMKNKKIHLFLGRFQPMHNAHLKVIKKIYSILGNSDKLVIALGSSQHSRTFENPLNVEEREEMIKSCFNRSKIDKYLIIHVPDFEKDEHWIEHLEKALEKIEPKFYAKQLTLSSIIVYSGNPRVIKIFSGLNSSKKKKLRMKKIKLIEGINSTKIRQLILAEEKWKHLVPVSVYEFLEKINFEKIVKKARKE